MNSQNKLFSLVEEHGGVEVRSKKHRVFRFPNGIQYVVSQTPSDPRTWDNAYSNLRRALGLTPQSAQVGARRVKPAGTRMNRGSGSQKP